MKKLRVLAALLLVLASPPVALAQVHLNWSGCGFEGYWDNGFACNDNTTLHQLVSSFIAPPGITHFIGATSEILVISPRGRPFGDWWAFQPGGCRAGALSSEDPSVIALGGCSTATYDGSTNVGLMAYEPNYNGNPHYAMIIVDMRRADDGVALDAGTEYQANLIQIRSTKTTGTGACAGCNQPVALLTAHLWVGQPTGADDQGISSCTSWRHGCSEITPNRRQSWGEVKSLYR